MVIAEIFRVAIDAGVMPAAEIAEAVWTDGDAASRLPLAPLTRDFVLPLLTSGEC
jgi:8-oxo-dGTP diphosphatase